MIFTRQQYIDLLKHKINTEFGSDPTNRKPSIAISDYCNPTKPAYDKKFIRILLSGFKFAGISHNNHDITVLHIEALINFFQVCSWTDFYIVLKLFPIMPVIIMTLQLLTFMTLLCTLLKNWSKFI